MSLYFPHALATDIAARKKSRQALQFGSRSPHSPLYASLKHLLFLSLLAAIPAGLLHAQTAQPTRVAIINAQKAVADTQEIKKAQAELQAKYGPRQQEIASLQQQLETLQTQLNSDNQTPEKLAQLRADFAEKQKKLQRMQEDLQSDVNDDRQQILGRAGRQMTEIIKKIAEARGIDVVIDTSNTLYFKPSLDITAEATAEYDKAYPAK
jgi:outer membrane protein